jgi:hypothetical protein
MVLIHARVDARGRSCGSQPPLLLTLAGPTRRALLPSLLLCDELGNLTLDLLVVRLALADLLLDRLPGRSALIDDVALPRAVAFNLALTPA